MARKLRVEKCAKLGTDPGRNSIFFDDGLRYAGLQQELKRLGSFGLVWRLEGVDCTCHEANVRFGVNDSFNFHDNFRIPMFNIGPPRDPNGHVSAPFNTIYIHWYWNENIPWVP